MLVVDLQFALRFASLLLVLKPGTYTLILRTNCTVASEAWRLPSFESTSDGTIEAAYRESNFPFSAN